MTDKKDVVCTLKSTNAVYGIIGSAPATLVVRVKDEELEIYVSVPFVVDADYINYGRVSCRVRYDNEQPTWESLNRSSDHQGAFFVGPLDVLDGLLTHKKMTIEIPPHDRAPVAAVFSLYGLKARIAQIESATGLKLSNGQKTNEQVNRPAALPAPPIVDLGLILR